MAKKDTKPHKASNYELAYYEAKAFLIAAEEISKKSQTLLLFHLKEKTNPFD